ncbi:antibiotic biosynthesis monooxygenase family protein [Shimia sp.]|uniref:antibiotic biosynthesis monooxygenase family protein n=1 Tax=Shimia sp. TaxID=1954381 RepID=UPI003B8AE22E
MIAVIFEVELKEGMREAYLSVAASLISTLSEIEGFISVERFQSVTQPDKLVSLSFFSSEDAVMQWRQSADHRFAQQQGRRAIFSDYRLRVANVSRDYGLTERSEAPDDSASLHEDPKT